MFERGEGPIDSPGRIFCCGLDKKPSTKSMVANICGARYGVPGVKQSRKFDRHRQLHVYWWQGQKIQNSTRRYQTA